MSKEAPAAEPDRQSKFTAVWAQVSRAIREEPLIIAAGIGTYIGTVILATPGEGLVDFRRDTLGYGIIGLSFILVISRYLGLFKKNTPTIRASASAIDDETRMLMRELRNYMAHTRPGSGTPAQVNIDDDFKGQLLARLTTESQNALSAFVESEVFKKAADVDQKQQGRVALATDIDQTLATYHAEMASWRRNANINLLIGLACAVGGIFVMWQTLASVALEIEPSGVWRVSDLYRVLSRFGLVIIIESVAFFFLKLYREDRSMIRYFRNEITNLEARYLSFKAALTFGTATDLTKILVSLASTERNFLVKKGDRVISDITYENSDILVERLLSRFPELAGKLNPAQKPG